MSCLYRKGRPNVPSSFAARIPCEEAALHLRFRHQVVAEYRRASCAARVTGYMSCGMNREPPHSKKARASKVLAPRQQLTIPYPGLGRCPARAVIMP